jgi:hypothetical protein
MAGLKNTKGLLYFSLGLGALTLASFGISNFIQAAADQRTSNENSPDTQNIRSLQPEGSNCDQQYCSACGGCSQGPFNQVVQKEISPIDNLDRLVVDP